MNTNGKNLEVDVNAKFDERMIRRIDKAEHGREWRLASDILIRAHGYNNLRPAVRQHFIDKCPQLMLVRKFEAETKVPPKAPKPTPAPIASDEPALEVSTLVAEQPQAQQAA